jgi:hypothetical protein
MAFCRFVNSFPHHVFPGMNPGLSGLSRLGVEDVRSLCSCPLLSGKCGLVPLRQALAASQVAPWGFEVEGGSAEASGCLTWG